MSRPWRRPRVECLRAPVAKLAAEIGERRVSRQHAQYAARITSGQNGWGRAMPWRPKLSSRWRWERKPRSCAPREVKTGRDRADRRAFRLGSRQPTGAADHASGVAATVRSPAANAIRSAAPIFLFRRRQRHSIRPRPTIRQAQFTRDALVSVGLQPAFAACAGVKPNRSRSSIIATRERYRCRTQSMK